MRFGISEEGIAAAFKIFDRNQSGSINYEEFLRTIRGDMNMEREKWVWKAFAKMDKDHSGVIDI